MEQKNEPSAPWTITTAKIYKSTLSLGLWRQSRQYNLFCCAGAFLEQTIRSPPLCSNYHGDWTIWMILEVNKAGKYVQRRITWTLTSSRPTPLTATAQVEVRALHLKGEGSTRLLRWNNRKSETIFTLEGAGNDLPDSIRFEVAITIEETPRGFPAPCLRLLQDKRLADVRIVVGERELAAHKLLLSTMSPVLERMFSTDMKEKEEGIIEIKDASYEAWEQFLEFMYTGDISTSCLPVLAELATMSDKYDVSDLTMKIERDLMQLMTTPKAAIAIYEALEGKTMSPTITDELVKCLRSGLSSATREEKIFILSRPSLSIAVLAPQ